MSFGDKQTADRGETREISLVGVGIVATVIGLFAYIGCSNPPSSIGGRRHAAIPQTVEPSPTVVSRSGPATGVPTRTRVASVRSTRPTATRTPVEGAWTLEAGFVRDVTIPDGTQMAPGTVFTKTWRLMNTGSGPWLDETKLTWVGGLLLWAPEEVDVPRTWPGETVDVSVRMRVPDLPGSHRSNWQLCAGGHCFGSEVYVQIISSEDVVAATPAIESRATLAEAPLGELQPPPQVELGYACDRCIKGNVSFESGERIYHFPGCEYYDATVIDTDYGERWFSNEAEAVAAGWRKAYNCP